MRKLSTNGQKHRIFKTFSPKWPLSKTDLDFSNRLLGSVNYNQATGFRRIKRVYNEWLKKWIMTAIKIHRQSSNRWLPLLPRHMFSAINRRTAWLRIFNYVSLKLTQQHITSYMPCHDAGFHARYIFCSQCPHHILFDSFQHDNCKDLPISHPASCQVEVDLLIVTLWQY